MRHLPIAFLVASSFVAMTPAEAAVPQNKPAAEADQNKGVLPVGADGTPLNLDFETGTLKDWTATGDAFDGQPIRGDTVYPRRSDMKSEHAGEYWIGTYERKGDNAQGTLTSVPFKVTHPWASFLVGGGPHETTCVELVRADTKQVFFRASGHESENMERAVIDLQPHAGKEIFIRLVDKHSGHWGHINFDDFKFHQQKPVLPKRPPQSAAEIYQFAGLPPEQAAKVMTVPEGFKVTLFAGEPDVMQPIAMAIDDRGRLWVAEAYSYPVRRPEGQGEDRILIFEDTDGDGKFDKRTVFIDNLNLVSGLEVGFGGVWVGAAPYLMFIPIDESGDKPAGEPQILLDGWGYQDTHETLNAFTWGPDGWLYGCHGVFTHSRVGKAGSPDAERVPLNAGIWRYHPTKHVFEVFAHGTSNPWGVDFNDYGQCFLTACVIPHLFHMIQGARYERQGGQHFNPYTYDDLKTIADHRHYVGNQWRDADRATSDSVGGGHAHAGAMVYLGGTWPEKYRGQIFMNNIHGARINMDVLTPSGSGYVGSHGPDFLLANDSWSQIINLQYGPDGNVYMIDWYDKNQCHRVEIDAHDRTNGRIFKVSYVGGERRAESGGPAKIDLKKLSDAELVELQLHPNDWYVRHARRILQERAAGKDFDRDAILESLSKIAFEHPDEIRRLRGLWALHASGWTGTLDLLRRAMHDENASVRAWSIQLFGEVVIRPERPWGYPYDRILRSQVKEFTTMARSDPSPLVRLYMASILQRFPQEERWDSLQALCGHSDDAKDHNLALMYWYAAEPLADKDMTRALTLAAESKVPVLLPNMVRRIASIDKPEALNLLVESLNRADQPEVRLAYLSGVSEALKGRRQVPMPAGWAEAAGKLANSDNPQIRALAAGLAVTFGDPKAMASLRKLLAEKTADVGQRKEAMASLLAARDRGLATLLQSLVQEPALRREAIRGLAAYDEPKTPEVLLGVYSSLPIEEKRDALATLAARPAYAKALLVAVAAKKVSTVDVSAELVRQLRNLPDEELKKLIGEVWGIVRDTPEEKNREIRRYRGMIAAKQATAEDLPLGRALFAKTCEQCHTLFGVGAKIGPDLTGSNRADLNYLLSNVLDPSAVVAKEYQPHLIATNDGRVITGLVLKDDGKVLTLATATETITLPKADIDEMKLSDKSMMPDDLLKQLKDDEVRSLVAYLASPTQVPMLATIDNVKSFFNGQDLTGWDGDPSLWSVENGEIVGKTKGINHNEFLRSHLLLDDFRLSVKVKLVPNEANSGIQFRSEALTNGEVKGPQADIGAGWWGKLYEEHGRGLIWDKSGESYVRAGEWNSYDVLAVGSRIRTYINGSLCVDLDDPDGTRRGIIALQVHSGGSTEVRFKDFRLELRPNLDAIGGRR